MNVQDYILNFPQHYKYVPCMVADPRAQMNKFIHRLLDLVKIECKNAMSLLDMNISRLMNHTQKLEVDKIREQDKESKKARTCKYEYSQQKQDCGNPRQGQQIFLSQPHLYPVFHPLCSVKIRKAGHKGLSLRDVFQVPKHTRLSLRVVRIIEASVQWE